MDLDFTTLAAQVIYVLSQTGLLKPIQFFIVFSLALAMVRQLFKDS